MYKLELLKISKEFSGFYANKDITLRVRQGTVHALIGENGAGKSTLMSILFGMYSPTSGSIKVDGNSVVINNPNQALDIGIGMVHQHFKLVDDYTNLQNIVLGSEFTSKLGFLDLNKSRIKIEAFQKKYKLNFNLDQKTSEATVSTQQKVEIMKMLYRDANILIFDEPTAVLTPQEIDELLKIIIELKESGKTIIFISHKLWEIKTIADEATIIRHGKVVKHYENLDLIEPKQIAADMVGRTIVESKNEDHNFLPETALELKNIFYKKLKNVNLDVHKGEILAIAGVEGNGQEEIEEILTGIYKPNSGHIIIKNRNGVKDITNFSTKHKNQEFISIIPADRHKHGLVLDFSINDNSIIRKLDDKEIYQIKNNFLNKINNFFKFINKKTRDNFSRKIIKKYDVRGSQDGYALARNLSGGNQQKAIVGREILSDHDFILIVQPTRGLDIGAINYIHDQILNDKKKGKAIILISYELDEVLSLADTVAVINKGEIVDKGPISNFTREDIGLLMAGKVQASRTRG
ncbi:MAG: ABC transporter ATP-binding protein [Mycoplasma sp.]|nr:ABC transporter ATP-binding protein [Mycoplasma sp.]